MLCAADAFRVTWSEKVYRPFVSDTSPKCIDLKRRRTGTSQRPDISKVMITQVTCLHRKKKVGTEMCIKFESEEISITGDYCSKSDSKEEDRGKGTVVCVA